jgi:hypothetical protein
VNNQNPKNIFDASVMQDKFPPRRFTSGTVEPLSAIPPAENRPKHHGSETRQTCQVGSRIPFHIKSELQRIAKLKGWTESYTVNVLIQKGLARDLAESFGVMLKATIQEAIATQMDKERKENNRAANFALESFRSSEEGRVISLYVLRFLLGEDIGIMPEIIKQSQDQTRDYIKQFFSEIETTNKQWQSSNSGI